MRALYCFVLRAHPPAFRDRFSGEMLSVFDDETRSGLPGVALLLDALASLARQWVRRIPVWTTFVAVCLAFAQICWFVYPRKAHGYWAENARALTSDAQYAMALTLLFAGILFTAVLVFSVWALRIRLRQFPRSKKQSFTYRN